MIDAHHHLWNLSTVNYPWLMEKGAKRFFGDPTPIQRNYEAAEFSTEAGAEGVTQSVHIQVGADDPWAEAVWVDGQAQETPGWPAAQVAFCDLADGDAELQLDRLMSLPTVRGVRQIVGRAAEEDAASGTNALLSNSDFVARLGVLAEEGLSFDLQLTPPLMAQAADIFGAQPDLQVALCHAGSPHDRSPDGLALWAEQLKPLSGCPNITCKLSGLGMFDHGWTPERFRPIVDVVLEQFGAERVMFGSNFPVDKLTSSYADLVAAYRDLIPAQDHDAVFRATAARFYRLD